MSFRRGLAFLAGVLLLLAGCKSAADRSSTAASGSEKKKISSMERNKGKQDAAAKQWVPGPTVAPLTDLLAWLSAYKQTMRLPVVAVPPGPFNSRFSNRYYIGVETAQPEAERMYLKMDDGGMGISLADRVRELKLEGPSVLWVEGRWGPLLDMPGADPSDKVFAVRKVGRWTGDISGGNTAARVLVVK